MILKALGVAFVLVAGALAPAFQVGPAAAADPPGVTIGPPCADWAGRDAVALGSPRRSVASVGQAGIVELRYRQGESWAMAPLTSAMLGMALQPGGRFGTAVTSAHLTSGDQCPDLLIGMPGAEGDRGAVVLVPDFGVGLEPSAAVWLPIDTAALGAGDRLGTAVATVRSDWIAGTPEVRIGGLVVIAGAPGWDAAGASNAGALVTWRIPVTEAATRDVGVEPPRLLHQGSGGLGDRTEWGDRLGAVVATGDGIHKVMVGVPYEDIGARTNAGAVIALQVHDGVLGSAEMRWLGHGLPGSPRAGDRLGAAVALGDEMTVIGVPGRDANRRRNSGAVVVGELVWDESNQVDVPRYRVVTQNTRGIPGSSETGDGFGSSLAAGNADGGDDTITVVGSPGEDADGRRNVGAVTVLSYSDGWALRARGLAAGDRFGSSLVIHNFSLREESRCSDVYVGAPGEDRPGARDAGRYYVRACQGTRVVTVFANGRRTGERFGA